MDVKQLFLSFYNPNGMTDNSGKRSSQLRIPSAKWPTVKRSRLNKRISIKSSPPTPHACPRPNTHTDTFFFMTLNFQIRHRSGSILVRISFEASLSCSTVICPFLGFFFFLFFSQVSWVEMIENMTFIIKKKENHPQAVKVG